MSDKDIAFFVIILFALIMPGMIQLLLRQRKTQTNTEEISYDLHSSETTPVPCSACGKAPRLKERWWRNTPAGPLLVTKWYECRRWLGLRLCNIGSNHTNEKAWET